MFFIPAYIDEKEKNNKLYLYNKMNSSEIELDSTEEKNEYSKLVKEGCQSIQTELQEVLHEEEILVSAEEQMKNLLELKEEMKRILFLTIMATEACNFDCVYCYESHECKTMTSSTVEGLKKWINTLAKTQHIKEVVISWFGGEPTLCVDIICDIMDHIHGVFNNDVTVISSMTTNGYLLTISNFERLVKCGVQSYQITLDGFKHDEKRYLKSGEGTLGIIINNLLEIKEIDKEVHYEIMLRNNILAEEEDFSWYDYLKKLFGDDERFSYSVVTVAKLNGKNDDTFEVESTDDLEKRHFKYMEAIGLKCIHRCDNDILSNVCYAGYPNGYLVRADGRIGKCTIDLECEENQIGRIENGFLKLELDKLMYWNRCEELEECSNCASAMICMNKSCPIKQHRTGRKGCEV